MGSEDMCVNVINICTQRGFRLLPALFGFHLEYKPEILSGQDNRLWSNVQQGH
jgi:hypothetical protein